MHRTQSIFLYANNTMHIIGCMEYNSDNTMHVKTIHKIRSSVPWPWWLTKLLLSQWKHGGQRTRGPGLVLFVCTSQTLSQLRLGCWADIEKTVGRHRQYSSYEGKQFWSERSACAALGCWHKRSGHSTWHYFSFFRWPYVSTRKKTARISNFCKGS